MKHLQWFHNLSSFFFQIKDFLQFVKTIYNTIPSHLSKIFEPRSQIKVKDVTEVNVDTILAETFTTTTILTDKKNADNQNISVSFRSGAEALYSQYFNFICSQMLNFVIYNWAIIY